MKITEKEVKHVARLARLRITEEEARLFAGQLNDILNYAERLNQLDTEGVEPLSHVLPLRNVWREDRVGEPLSREKALENAPDEYQGFFRVPKIIE